MVNTARSVALVVLVSLATLVPTSTAAGTTPSIVIRSYDTSDVTRHHVRTMPQVVQELFRQAGIDARWRECRTARQKTLDPCDDVLGIDEVVLRIVAVPAQLHEQVAHVLMGTAQHSTRGLMRARWSDQELHRNVEGDGLFSAQEAVRMRDRIVARRR